MMRSTVGFIIYGLLASLALGQGDDDEPKHTPLNITAISSRDGYSVLQCWQLASIPIDAMQAANYPVGETTLATWSRIEPNTHVGEAWAPHVQLSVILNGLIRITSPAPDSDSSTGENTKSASAESSNNESMTIISEQEQQPQLPPIVDAADIDSNNKKSKRPETKVAYIMPGTLQSSVVIAADLKSMSTIAGHYTEFPSSTEPTILVQIPFEGDKAPEHKILHDGPCI